MTENQDDIMIETQPTLNVDNNVNNINEAENSMDQDNDVPIFAPAKKTSTNTVDLKGQTRRMYHHF